MIGGRIKGTPDRWEHGTRARYVGEKCRCGECRRANREYVAKRTREAIYGRKNPMVPTEPVREYLAELRRDGVGRRVISAASGVPESSVGRIMSGEKKFVRETTAVQLLGVTIAERAGGALVPAERMWKLIGLLLEEGYDEARLATELGLQTPRIQFQKGMVLAATARAVEALYAELKHGVPRREKRKARISPRARRRAAE